MLRSTTVASRSLVLLAVSCSPDPVAEIVVSPALGERPAPDDAAAEGIGNFVEVRFMLRGYCFAGSRIEDDQALGGFGPSENLPEDIESPVAGAAAEPYLLAQPAVVTEFRGLPAMRLVLVNPTDEALAFDACDSRLSIVQEAKDEAGDWRPVEYLPSSWCGNSYHRVMLGAGQFWSFPAPRYRGTFTTELRFRLDLGEGGSLVSNTFAGSVNPEQFSVRQEYQPTNLMDPYPAEEPR